MTKTPHEISKLSERERETYQKAHTCRYCTDTFDSKGNYVSTYCYRFHRHVLGFANGGLMLCGNCVEIKESEETR